MHAGRQLIGRTPLDARDLIAWPECASREAAHKHRFQGQPEAVFAYDEQALYRNRKAGLFSRLATEGVFQCLTGLDPAADQSPWVAASERMLQQHDAAGVIENYSTHSNRELGVEQPQDAPLKSLWQTAPDAGEQRDDWREAR